MLYIPLARSLVYDVLVVVVPEAARQLLVVHLGLVFPHAPAPGNLQRGKIARKCRKQGLLFRATSTAASFDFSTLHGGGVYFT